MMLIRIPDVPVSAPIPDVVNVVSAASIGFMYCLVAPSFAIVLTSSPSTYSPDSRGLVPRPDM